jgi:hypothetical protein
MILLYPDGICIHKKETITRSTICCKGDSVKNHVALEQQVRWKVNEIRLQKFQEWDNIKLKLLVKKQSEFQFITRVIAHWLISGYLDKKLYI